MNQANMIHRLPEELIAAADEAQQACTPIAEKAGASVLVLVFDDQGGFQVRSTNQQIDLNAAVGVLFRAAATVHSLRTVMRFDAPGEQGEAAG